MVNVAGGSGQIVWQRALNAVAISSWNTNLILTTPIADAANVLS